MLIPTKYENIEKSALVLGAEVISLLKTKPYNIEMLFREVKSLKGLSLDQFYDILLFFWLADIIELRDEQIFLKAT